MRTINYDTIVISFKAKKPAIGILLEELLIPRSVLYMLAIASNMFLLQYTEHLIALLVSTVGAT